MRSSEEQVAVIETCYVAGEMTLYRMFNELGFTAAEAVSALLALKRDPDC